MEEKTKDLKNNKENIKSKTTKNLIKKILNQKRK